MSETTVVNNIANYTYASPRYNATRAYVTDKIPNDYGHHDGLNGTYDKWFPLYRLTSTEQPTLELINYDGTASDIKGTLALRPILDKYKKENYGAIKGNSEQPFNSNLEKQTVFYTKWMGPRLNPAWMTIQNKIDNSNPSQPTYLPFMVVRVLGNEAVTSNIHTIELGENRTWSNAEFQPGMIVRYKKNIWKCLMKTREYPPTSPYSSTIWQIYKGETNIFYADLFSLAESGETDYMLEVSEPKRKFNPLTEGDDLICWNLSYYHTI